jgi:hypothetical protein
MTKPTAITIPGIARHLERFLRPAVATAGDGVEIRQDATGTTVSVCEGRHAATITTPIPGDLEPILVDPVVIAGTDPTQPIKIYRMTETSGVITNTAGELVTITIRNGTATRSARDLADVVEGEIASGMTRTVFEVDPRHLLAVAEALAATGAEKVTIAVAPRWNVLACIAETTEICATFMIAGETFGEETAGDKGEKPDPLEFEIAPTRRGGGRSSRPKTPPPLTDQELQDLPF